VEIEVFPILQQPRVLFRDDLPVIERREHRVLPLDIAVDEKLVIEVKLPCGGGVLVHHAFSLTEVDVGAPTLSESFEAVLVVRRIAVNQSLNPRSLLGSRLVRLQQLRHDCPGRFRVDDPHLRRLT